MPVSMPWTTWEGSGLATIAVCPPCTAAVTVIFGSPALWYGGHTAMVASPDPSHVVQGILTGIGFLGAGVIMREGLSIRGLTTAASIWSSSAIGVCGRRISMVQQYCSPRCLLFCMIWVSRLEHWLPSRAGVAIAVRFQKELPASRGGIAQGGAPARV